MAGFFQHHVEPAAFAAQFVRKWTVLRRARRGRFQRCGAVCLLAFGLLLPFADSIADDALPTPAPLPSSLPPIPAVRDKTGLILNRNNEAAYEDILIAPLAAWLKDGRAVFRVVRNFDSPYSPAPAFIDASERNPSEYDLAPDGTVSRHTAETPSIGWPFGLGDEVAHESDPVRRAMKLLWNIEYSLSASGDTLSSVELAWIGTQSKLRSATGLLYSKLWLQPPAPVRAAPKSGALPAAQGAPPAAVSPGVAAAPAPSIQFGQPGDLLRLDGLRLTVPTAVSGYTRFSRRARGAEEDRFWTFSPVLGRLREELAANRSDGILGSSISFDDLNVWSGKSQSVSARVVDQKVLLVPFPAATFYRAEAGAVAEVPRPEGALPQTGKAPDPAPPRQESALTVRGYQQRSDGTAAMVVWNHESRQYAQFAPWVPTSVVLIPRKVIILELEQQDPYVGIGRTYLFVDQELQLPVYKMVYDRVGDYRKTVVGGWGLAQSKDGKIRFPFLAFLLVVDQSNQTVSTLTSSQVQTFLGRDTPRSVELRGWFDAERYPKPHADDTTKQEQKKTPAPAAGGGDDETGQGAVDSTKTAASRPEPAPEGTSPAAEAPEEPDLDAESAH